MSVFRELFVEVPQAILEAKLRQAADDEKRWQEAEPTRAALIHRDTEWAISHIALARGWEWCETDRASNDHITRLRVILRCGHYGLFRFDEHDMLIRTNSELVDYILGVLDQPPRRKCTCIEYIPPQPCNHGVCK